jgi:phage gpG-like protein
MATLMRTNLAKLSQVIRDAADANRIDWRGVLEPIRFDVIQETKENFDAGKSPDGTPFKPLRWPRANSKGADKPLRDFGLLGASVTSPGAQGNIDDQAANRFEWGTNLDYSTIHQYGGIITPKVAKFLAIPATVDAKRAGSPRNWPAGELKFQFRGAGGGVAKDLRGEIQYYFTKSVTIPARPFLGITEEKAKEYAEWAGEYAAEQVAKGIEGAGGAG